MVYQDTWRHIFFGFLLFCLTMCSHTAVQRGDIGIRSAHCRYCKRSATVCSASDSSPRLACRHGTVVWEYFLLKLTLRISQNCSTGLVSGKFLNFRSFPDLRISADIGLCLYYL